MPKRFLFCDDNHFPFSRIRIFENAARGGRVTLLTVSSFHFCLEVLAQQQQELGVLGGVEASDPPPLPAGPRCLF